MAEAFLRHRLGALGVEARVSSAGLLFDDVAAPAEGVAAMAAAGFDTSAHRSRRVAADMILGADLVLGMAREHLRHAVVLAPPAWPRTFTLKELVRRAEQTGPRAPGQPFDEWLAKVHAGRSTDMLAGASRHDDVADPIGQGPEVYGRVADEIDALTARLVELGWRRATTGGART